MLSKSRVDEIIKDSWDVDAFLDYAILRAIMAGNRNIDCVYAVTTIDGKFPEDELDYQNKMVEKLRDSGLEYIVHEKAPEDYYDNGYHELTKWISIRLY